MSASYQAYQNLITKTWSLRRCGRVICHPTWLIMIECDFHVSPTGLARVRARKCREVFAWVKGDALKWGTSGFKSWWLDEPDRRLVRFNPYEQDFFFYADEPNVPVRYAQSVIFSTDKRIYVA